MSIGNKTLGVVLAGTTLSLALGTPLAHAEGVSVGHLADHSGPTAEVGIPYSQGVEDAVAYVNTNGGIGGRKIDMAVVDYSYQVPRAMAAYKNMSTSVVSIQGWGTADTEALSGLVTKDRIAYFSASYAAQLTDPVGGSKVD